MMKKILSLLAISMMLMACTKVEEVDNYVLPRITMDSCVVTSGNSFMAYMTVDKGESFSNHSLQMLVYDAKDVDHVLSAINVELTDERVQNLQKSFTAPAEGSEYLVSAVMKTEKNSFKSNSLMVSLAKMTAESYLHLWGQPSYYDDLSIEGGSPQTKFATDDVALHLSALRHFGIVVRAAMTGQPVSVRVGSHVYPIASEDWYGYGYWDPEDDNIFGVTMADDIEPGTYDVALHWGDVELPLPKKIRILPLKEEKEETTPFSEFKDLPHGARASFRIGDRMYYYTQSETNMLVSCDLNTKTWTKHRNVPYQIVEIVAVGSKAYGITEDYTWDYEHGGNGNYTVTNALCEYDSATDTWRKLSDVPTEKGVVQLRMFTASGHVYICGGYYPNPDYHIPNQQCMDTWKYDISTGKWTKMADRPTKHTVMQAGSGETNGYFMTPEGHLWVYDSNNDVWSKGAQLTPVYDSTKLYQCLIEHDGKLYYAGTHENSSIYVYDFTNKSWELLGLYGDTTIAPYMLTGTFHNGKLILGPMLEYAGYEGAKSMTFFNFEMK